MTPSRRLASVRRYPVVVGVPVVLVLMALVAGLVGTATIPAAPTAAASVVAPVPSQSSTWFCTGGGSSGPATVAIEILNTADRSVTGTVHTVDAEGASGQRSVTVPPHRQVTVLPGTTPAGRGLGSTVELAGGGVAVTQVVHGAAGWSQAPCTTYPGDRWLFPVGETTAGNTLTVSLYNPASTTAVADLAFLTPGGAQAPQSFQGIVIPPGAVTVRNVGAYVQDDAEVATSVTVRSGVLVATELEQHGQTGLALLGGSPEPSSRWNIGRSVNVTNGSVRMYLANPGPTTARVTVSVQLPTGALTPVRTALAPETVADVDLGALPTIPIRVGYLTRVRVRRGSGIVVGRVVTEPAGGPGSWGASPGIDELLGTHTSAWVLPAPPRVVSGAAVSGVTLIAPKAAAIRERVRAVAPGRASATAATRSHHLLAVPAGGSLTFAPVDPGAPMVVQGTEGASVTEDLGPGAVSSGGVPVASP